MLPMTTLKPLLVAPILISAGAFLAASALVITRARPLLLRGSQLMWVVAAASLPLVIAAIVLASSVPDPAVTCFASVQVALLLLMVAAIRRTAGGYTVLGVTGESLRAALRAAIADLGIPFEETMLGFSLGAMHSRLRTKYEPRLGAALLQLEPPGGSGVLKQIAKRVNHYLQADRHSVSLGSAALYGVFGLFMLVLALYQSSRL